MKFHKTRKDCTMNGDCLMQDHDDVESCEDIIEYDLQYGDE